MGRYFLRHDRPHSFFNTYKSALIYSVLVYKIYKTQAGIDLTRDSEYLVFPYFAVMMHKYRQMSIQDAAIFSYPLTNKLHKCAEHYVLGL